MAKAPPRPRSWYVNRARQYARGAGIDENIFVRQISQESGFNPSARSPAGAIGIAQIVPKWHPGVDPTNPDASLRYAATHMANLHKRYGNYEDALSVYNSGRPFSEGRKIGETRAYVAKILNGQHPQNSKAFGGTGHSPNTDFGRQQISRPNFLAANILQQAESLARGGRFDLGSLSTAMQLDRQAVASGLHGMDSGGGKNDPRVRMEPVKGYAGPGGAKQMMDAVNQARRMGLTVSEQSGIGDKVDPVHVKDSYHYQLYPGTKWDRASDISGTPKQMAAYYRWAQGRFGNHITEMFYDPLGGIKNGKQIGAIGGHSDHVHIAF